MGMIAVPGRADRRVPVAVFTYNRPAHAERVLASLSRCMELERCAVWLFCDGARGPADVVAVEQNQKVVDAWIPKLNARKVVRRDNWGLARSIATSVSQLCNDYGSVIVLEDDLVVSPSFIHFMLAALEHYESVDVVKHVSGYMFPIGTGSAQDAMLLPIIDSWGWATWQRAWQAFEWTPSVEALDDRRVRRRFDVDGAYSFTDILRARMGGLNDSWAILWYWAVFRTNGISVFPTRSLVWNGGFDGTGTHCGTQDFPNQQSESVTRQLLLPPALMFPSDLTPDLATLRRVSRYLRTAPGGAGVTRTRVRARLRRLFDRLFLPVSDNAGVV